MNYIALPFLCFRCRRSWKIDCSNCAWFDEWGVEQRGAQKNGRPCPICRGPLVFGGAYLRTPPQSNVRRWRILEELFRSGWRDDYPLASARTLVRSAPAAREYGEQVRYRAALDAKQRATALKKSHKAARRHKAA